MVQFDTVILAGGRGSRLATDGARVDKAAVLLKGEPLISRALRAAEAGHGCVVVGMTATDLPHNVIRIADDQPDAGPAYALKAGVLALNESSSPWVLVLSCDIPGAVAGAQVLAARDLSRYDGAVIVDESGKRQWLLGIYRAEALRRISRDVQPHTALRVLFEPLNLLDIAAPAAVTRDVDTWHDHAWWETNLQ